jgi:hypothetical protein
LESTTSEPKRSVELMPQEAVDVDADKSFRFNKTLVDLKLSKSVRIDINLLYFVMIFLDSVM